AAPRSAPRSPAAHCSWSHPPASLRSGCPESRRAHPGSPAGPGQRALPSSGHTARRPPAHRCAPWQSAESAHSPARSPRKSHASAPASFPGHRSRLKNSPPAAADRTPPSCSPSPPPAARSPPRGPCAASAPAETPAPDPEQAFQQALKQRKDLAAASEQLEAAKANRKAAFDQQLPVANFSGDFGDLGTTPGHSHGTYAATAQVSAAILQIQSAAKLVDATKSNVQLASEALNEAQQRFKAGVSDNLPVSQSLSQLEQANDQYISALYQHNVAKLSLARALGVASTNYKDYLGGK